MPTPNTNTQPPIDPLLMVRYSTATLAFLPMYSWPRGDTKRRGELRSRLSALHGKHLIIVCLRPRRATPQTKREARSA